MLIDEFDYYLPKELIAQQPSEIREKCRLLYYNRKTGAVRHLFFEDILNYLTIDDVLVINNSRVMPARIIFSDNRVDCEILLISQLKSSADEIIYDCIIKPGRKFKPGRVIDLSDSLYCKVIDYSAVGRILGFYLKINRQSVVDKHIDDYLTEIGSIPLPPYITEFKGDCEFYQTVYSKVKGSAAAPTAGLHFSAELLDKIRKKITDIIEITLHIGPGTFQPVKSRIIEEHKMHSEYFSVCSAEYDKLSEYKKRGKRIIAVGTTSCRVLETLASLNLANINNNEISNIENPRRLSGYTDLYIYPGYQFQFVDAIITNFHLPKSSLLILVSAFANVSEIKRLYKEAIARNYRFFSFGDAMLIE